jgi:ABC-type phosphate transport system substrate-binding protein
MSRGSRLRVAMLGAALAAVGAGAGAGTASAATCDGGDIYGRGATFQNDAHNAAGGWIDGFDIWCGGTAGQVEYNRPGETETGSGGGLRSFGSTNGTLPDGSTGNTNDVDVRFAGTDEPPAGTVLTNIENNGTRDVRVFPVAQASITIPVNLPDGCTIDSALIDAGDGRVKITNARVEQAFAASTAVDTWGELLDGSETSSRVSCAGTRIVRAVRSDVSGTTFQFRKYLQKYVASGENWDARGSSTSWPNEVVGTNIIKGNGNGGVASTVANTEGSIGYVVLSTARSNGFNYSGAGDDEYWIRLDQRFRNPQTGIISTIRVDPADDHTTATTNVSNCNDPGRDRRFTGLPAGPTPSNGNWTQASSIKSETGTNPLDYYTANEYAICALTFTMAWQDYSNAYERQDNLYGTPTELEAEMRNVRDYVEYILTPVSADPTGGQGTLDANDYAQLPGDVNNADLRDDVPLIQY